MKIKVFSYKGATLKKWAQIELDVNNQAQRTVNY
jgi:hypothetical protein